MRFEECNPKKVIVKVAQQKCELKFGVEKKRGVQSAPHQHTNTGNIYLDVNVKCSYT